MAQDFISEQEMAALEKAGKVKNVKQNLGSPDFLSDDEMSTLEKSGLVKDFRPQKKSTLGAEAQTALESYGNTVLLGHLPQAQALASKLVPDPGMNVDKSLTEQGFKISQPEETYVSEKDKNIQRISAQEAENPKAAMLGTGLGIGGSVLLGGAAGKALGITAPATLGGRVAQSAKIGAGYGALQNPGDVEGEIDVTREFEGRAKGALKGGILGVLAQGAVEGGSKIAQRAAKYYEGKANEKAFKAMTGAGKKDFELALAQNKVGPIGRTGLNEGIVTPLASSTRIAERIETAKKEVGKKIGDILDSNSVKGTIDPEKIAVEIYVTPEVQSMYKTPGMEPAAKRIESMLETLASNGKSLSLREAQRLRQGIDKSINFNKRVPEMSGLQKNLYEIRDAISESMNGVVNEADVAAGGQTVDRLQRANRTYSNLAQADKLINKKLAGDASNRSVSLTDTMAGLTGIASGGALPQKAALGAAFGAANKFGRTFGNSLQATGFDAASRALTRSGAVQKFAQESPVAYQALFAPKGKSSFQKSVGFEIFDNPEIQRLLEKDPKLIDNIEDPRLRAEAQRRFARNPASSEDSAIKRRLQQ